jgi:ketosteroid isomerase-like protein
MTTKTVSSLLIAAVALLAGCAGAPAVNSQADIAAINASSSAYSAAAERGDAVAWLALWDEAGVQMLPNAPARSKEQLVAQVPAQWQARLEASDLKMFVTPLEVQVSGDWAYSRGVYAQEFTNKKTGQKALVDGKFLTVYRRQPEGSWKIYRDCFNSNLPAVR